MRSSWLGSLYGYQIDKIVKKQKSTEVFGGLLLFILHTIVKNCFEKFFGGCILGKSSIVYIDGFNLYYGLLKDSDYKWLNLEKCFTLLRQDDNIQKIKYFTARVIGNASSRQDVYLDAIATYPLVEIIYGLFKEKKLKCKVSNCSSTHKKIYSTYEEKRTDVNIATSMLDDAYKGECERIILVSGDSDLVPAVDLIKRNFPQIEVIVYIPASNPKRGAATQLRNSADKNKTLDIAIIKFSQLSDPVISSSGNTFSKPNTW